MKKSVLFAIGIIATAAACSSQEESDISPNAGNAINFSATAPKGSRAQATTTATLQSFKVYGYTPSSVIMDGVIVSREGGKWTYSPVVYWPASTVNFYAVSPTSGDASVVSGDNGLRVENVSCGSYDWLYAVTLNQHEGPSPVPLTFQHAMSKVAVMLSSTNEKYNIEVQHVSLNNIALSADFTLPQLTTSSATAQATWGEAKKSGKVLLYYDMSGESIQLTTTPVDPSEGNLEMSYFVPQHLTPLAYDAKAGFTGSYMQIDCIIRDKATGEKIWPSENTPDYLIVPETDCGMMVFPLAANTVKSWNQGESYIYNVVINNTYTLDTIMFEPTVKDYIVETPY